MKEFVEEYGAIAVAIIIGAIVINGLWSVLQITSGAELITE